MHYILAHDFGTSGDKAVLFSEEGTIIASAYSPYETRYPHPGWAEQEPDDYWKAFCESTRHLIRERSVGADRIGCVVFSAQMTAPIPVDDSGRALAPAMTYADTRTVPQTEEIGRRMSPERVYRVTGNRLDPSYSAPKIMWIREHLPEVYKKARVFLQVKDYVVRRLTGRSCTDYSDATATSLLDITALEWSGDLLDVTEIEREKLPELMESTAVIGSIQRDAARACGLLEGTPVVIGGGDAPCATSGAGAVNTGDMYFNIGTSSWIGLTSDEPLLDEKMRVFNLGHLVKGKYTVTGAMQCGGGSVSWFIDGFCRDNDRKVPDNDRRVPEPAKAIHERLTHEARAIAPGCEGLVFLPYLMGERSPIWDPHARGTFIGLSRMHGRAHLYRAVLEGVAYHMKSIQEIFEENGAVSSELKAIGGGIQNELWLSIFADVLERTVVTLNVVEEATSVGACIAGGVGIGLYRDAGEGARIIKKTCEIKASDAGRPLYTRNYNAFRKSYTQLASVFPLLSGL